MAFCKYLTVFLVLTLSAIYKAEAADDLLKVCERLNDKKFLINTEDAKDADKFHTAARRLLADLWSFGNLYGVAQFEVAWGKVVKRQGCYPTAFSDVAIIAKCAPQRFVFLHPLFEATSSLVEECFTPDFIAEKIRSELKSGGCLLTGCFKGAEATELIDHWFVEDYRNDNDCLRPGHWWVLSDIKSEKAYKALQRSIVRELKRRNKDPNTEEFTWNTQRLQKYLEKRLYKPCKSYVEAADKIMTTVAEISVFRFGQLPGLLSELDQNSQEAAFRYTLCKDFGAKHRPENLAREIRALINSEE